MGCICFICLQLPFPADTHCFSEQYTDDLLVRILHVDSIYVGLCSQALHFYLGCVNTFSAFALFKCQFLWTK